MMAHNGSQATSVQQSPPKATLPPLNASLLLACLLSDPRVVAVRGTKLEAALVLAARQVGGEEAVRALLGRAKDPPKVSEPPRISLSPGLEI